MRSSVYSRSLKKSDVKEKIKQHEAFKNSLADLAALGGGLSWGGLLETVEERRVPDGLYGLAAGFCPLYGYFVVCCLTAVFCQMC